MRKITVSAPGRISLIGNPSDIYGGKVISMAIKERAFVTIEESPKLLIEGNNCIEKNLVLNRVHDLVKACIKRLNLENNPMRISYKNEIPFQCGLGGSAAICVATIGALREYFNLKINDFDIAEQATFVELHDLGLVAGQQDRYISVFGGIQFMDFAGKENQREGDPYGKIIPLSVEKLPVFLALFPRKASSGQQNKNLRERFVAGDMLIKKRMADLAALATQGKNLLLKKQWQEFGRLMILNQLIRNELNGVPTGKIEEVFETAIKFGAYGARICGGNATLIILANKKARQKIMGEFPDQNFFDPKKENKGLIIETKKI